VKTLENVLESKETKLEEMVKDNSEWGSDSIDMPHLIPHFPEPPQSLRRHLKELGDSIHNRVSSLRMELFGHHGHDGNQNIIAS